MSQIAFTHYESSLLQELLLSRLRLYSLEIKTIKDIKGQIKYENAYINPLNSVMDKISTRDINLYSEREKLICTSCINEHRSEFDDAFDFESPLEWLSLSEDKKA